MVKYERYKIAKQSGNYSFSELSNMIDTSKSIKLTESEYQYHLGRLAERKSDFLVSPITKQFFTIGGSTNSRKMWKIKGKPLKVFGIYLN